MSKIGLQKELDYLIASKNNLFTMFIAVAGGTMGLFFANVGWVKYILISVGFIFSIAIMEYYFKKDDKIEEIIKDLKGDS